ncbi:hypothetical protein BAUCODRAFT_569676 [Baudoinia panamericana UAMH 10762]|uniref:RNA-dependent RNA polymerase n=1 Tax=Baudoinia panamericana (strain UAMH 10762) TaxID=717646 RepID=M2N109_BAUPA|nr:uncharacterized protein BAUCODRAFT_569676 [Baudoinia panamericana UAMH 10762]EMC92320.1 hypothetical protein BAUCODRAFT_569676 [Baudoinia panamericana UAMH 10762]
MGDTRPARSPEPSPAPPPPPPLTPQKERSQSGISAYLRTFCQTFNIELPIDVIASPSKTPRTVTYGLVNKIKLLYFRDRDVLDQTVDELRACQPTIRDTDAVDRLKVLDRRLEQAARLIANTPRRKRYANIETPNGCHVRANDEAPPSPTLAVKHAPPAVTHNAPFLEIPAELDDSSMTANTSFMSETTETSAPSEATAATSLWATQASNLLQSSWEPSQIGRLDSEIHRSFGLYVASDVAEPAIESASVPSLPKLPTEHHRVARIFADGLTATDIPPSLHTEPMCVKAEAYRVMYACGLSAEQLEFELKGKACINALHSLARRYNRRFKAGKETHYLQHTLAGRLVWTRGQEGRLFDLELYPARPEKSHPLQRKFGGHRILVVDFPDLDKLPKYIIGQKGNITARILEMLKSDHMLLGQKWTAFLNKKRKVTSVDPSYDDSKSFQISFFAVEGAGLDSINVVEAAGWAVPLRNNAEQYAAKAYSRLDLPVSRTDATIVFAPDAIEHIADIMSDDVPDASDFNDASLPFLRSDQVPVAMTDGCGYITYAAARRVQSILNLTWLPSAFQVRIAGAKGLLVVRQDITQGDMAQERIGLTQTQRKLQYSDSDLDDPARRTLDVVDYSKSVRSSHIPPGFLPVLRDRGVPKEAILDVVGEQVKLETSGFLQALKSRSTLHRWVLCQRNVVGFRAAAGGIVLTAGFPANTIERILFLLESWFEPAQCPYLRKQVLDFAGHVFDVKAKAWKLHLGSCTSVMMIPDWTQTLKPGEAYLSFSKPIKDGTSGRVWSSLAGMDILVARNPCIRNSDMQKLRAVSCAALAGIFDVIVFSTQGPRSLASKLSGGDYDGDIAWVCWDPRLVLPFKNAPAPWKLTDIKNFGIVKDNTKLGEVLAIISSNGEVDASLTLDENAVRRWLHRGIASRMNSSLLGTVTNLHAKLTYGGDISSEGATLLADLHDHLVDADKQGYSYTSEAFEAWRGRYVDIIPRSLPGVAHWRFTTKTHDEPSKAKPNFSDIVDYVYFGVLKPELHTAMHTAAKDLGSGLPCPLDTDLCALYADVALCEDKVIRGELEALQSSIKLLYERWQLRAARQRNKDTPDWADWEDFVSELRSAFIALQPCNPTHPAVREWLRPQGESLTMWLALKASSIARLYWEKGNAGSFVFSIAARELCELKARACGGLDGSRTIMNEIYLSMKPSKHVVIATAAEEMGFEATLEADYDGDDGFDAHSSLFDGIWDTDGIVTPAEATNTVPFHEFEQPTGDTAVPDADRDGDTIGMQTRRRQGQTSPATPRQQVASPTKPLLRAPKRPMKPESLADAGANLIGGIREPDVDFDRALPSTPTGWMFEHDGRAKRSRGDEKPAWLQQSK